MAVTLPTLDPTQEYEVISSIINAVGRDITIRYVSSRTDCTVCNGNDPFCPVCMGNPTTDVVAEFVTKANVRWKGSDRKLYAPEGQYMDGDCIVNFMIDAVGAYSTTDALIKKALSVTVDNRVCVIREWYFKGAPINRVYLVLKQDESVGEQRIG